jgi:hypothetical protein
LEAIPASIWMYFCNSSWNNSSTLMKMENLCQRGEFFMCQYILFTVWITCLDVNIMLLGHSSQLSKYICAQLSNFHGGGGKKYWNWKSCILNNFNTIKIMTVKTSKMEATLLVLIRGSLHFNRLLRFNKHLLTTW